MKAKPQYYAITGHDTRTRYTHQGGEVQELARYVVAGPLPTREQAEEAGRIAIGDVVHPGYPGVDMYRKTQHQNLTVVSKSALKKYHITEEEVCS